MLDSGVYRLFAAILPIIGIAKNQSLFEKSHFNETFDLLNPITLTPFFSITIKSTNDIAYAWYLPFTIYKESCKLFPIIINCNFAYSIPSIIHRYFRAILPIIGIVRFTKNQSSFEKSHFNETFVDVTTYYVNPIALTPFFSITIKSTNDIAYAWYLPFTIYKESCKLFPIIINCNFAYSIPSIIHRYFRAILPIIGIVRFTKNQSSFEKSHFNETFVDVTTYYVNPIALTPFFSITIKSTNDIACVISSLHDL